GRKQRRRRSESLNENFDRGIGQGCHEIGAHSAPPTGRTCRIEEGLELHVGHRLQLIGNDRPPFPQALSAGSAAIRRTQTAPRAYPYIAAQLSRRYGGSPSRDPRRAAPNVSFEGRSHCASQL